MQLDTEIYNTARSRSVNGGSPGDSKSRALKVITAQSAQLDKFLGAEIIEEAAMNAIKAKMNALQNNTCGLCKEVGHTASHCWFNGQLYQECRQTTELKLAYAAYRAAWKAFDKATKRKEVAKLREDEEVKMMKFETGLIAKRQKLF